MCGFASIVSLAGESIHVEQLKKMSHVISHRGPNSDGVSINDHVGMAFRRLSIQDLSDAGSQPMKSIDERYTIVFNGEIYNYIELREELIKLGFRFRSKSDTEVLLNAYIKCKYQLYRNFCKHCDISERRSHTRQDCYSNGADGRLS